MAKKLAGLMSSRFATIFREPQPFELFDRDLVRNPSLVLRIIRNMYPIRSGLFP